MENGLNALGRRIQILRESNMMTRADLAQNVGVTRRDIVDWEEGRALPTAQQVVEIARQFDADPRSLLDAEETLRETPAESAAPAVPNTKKKLTVSLVCLVLGICAALSANFLMQGLAAGADVPAASTSAQVEELIPLPECLALTAVETAQWDLDGDGAAELVNSGGADILFVQDGTAYALGEPLSKGQTLTAQDGVFIVKNDRGESRIYSRLRDGAIYPAG